MSYMAALVVHLPTLLVKRSDQVTEIALRCQHTQTHTSKYSPEGGAHHIIYSLDLLA